MTKCRAAFIPRNNLDSKKIPIFRPQTPPSPAGHEDSHLSTRPYNTSHLSQYLPRPLSSTNEVFGKTLNELGDSSSLFSLQSPPDDWPACTSLLYLGDQSPVFLESGEPNKRRQPQKKRGQVNNMVNERSPAKAPLHPVMAGEQHRAPLEAESSLLSKSLQATTPQFGQPNLPQSSLHLPAQKESNVFFQPKSRPEHHRNANNLGMVLTNPSRYEFNF